MLKQTGIVFLVGLAALAASVGIGRISAQQASILDYCPSHGGSTDCATAATMFLQFGRPSDDELVADINAIAAQLHAHPAAARASADASDAIRILAAAIRNRNTRALVVQLANSLCDNGAGSFVGSRTSCRAATWTPTQFSGGNGNGGNVFGVRSSSSSSGASSSGASSSGASSSGASSSGASSSGASSSGASSSGASSSSSSGSSGTSSSSSGSSGQSSSGSSG